MNKNTSNIFYIPALSAEWTLLDSNYEMLIDLYSEHLNHEFAKDFDLWGLSDHNN